MPIQVKRACCLLAALVSVNLLACAVASADDFLALGDLDIEVSENEAELRL
jgi:hypothetical protein